MCRGLFLLIFSLLLLGNSYSVATESADESRLLGFAQHQKENRQFDKAREAGEMGWLEQQEQWDEVRRKEGDAYKRNRKAEAMPDDGPLAKADEVDKMKLRKAHEAERLKYIEQKAKDRKVIANTAGLPTPAQELGLDEERPRYDYRKRASFGGKSQWKGGAASSGSSSSGRGSSLPAPPTFDDIDGGYVPAPNMDDFGDIPPPPPPPPPMYNDDLGGGTGGGDFIPPPPPPPNFGDDPDF